MATLKNNITRWLNSLPDDANIAIDDDGLCLIQVGSSNYLEVGGAPESIHEGCECAYCDRIIEDETDGTSSPHGSMHLSCAKRHEREHPNEW